MVNNKELPAFCRLCLWGEWMAQILKRFFAVEGMLKPGELKGVLPSSQDMYQRLTRIAIPSVVEMVFMSVISSVDMIMLRGLDNPATAIAAVGLAGQPRMLALSVFFALNVGVTAIVSRRKGEERQEDANRALRNAMLIVLVFALFVGGASVLWARPLLLFAGAQPDTIDMAVSYFTIMSYFTPISVLTMCINSALRGVGNTKAPMYNNIVANLSNAFLNTFFIYGLKSSSGGYIIEPMEVAGAAWASGIGICIGFALCLASVTLNKNMGAFLHLSLKDNWRLHKETVQSIFKVGGNAALEQIAMRIGFFTYAIIVASLGTNAVAAHHVGMQFLSLSFTFGDGIAVAATSLVGQSLGQKRPDLASIYSTCAQRISLCSSFILATLIAIFRAPLIGIFLDSSLASNAEPFAMAMNVLIVISLFQPLQMVNIVIVGCLRGAGDNLHVAIVMIICVVFIRPILSFVAINYLHLGLIGAWCSALIDMSIRLTLTRSRFKSGKWQLKKV